VPSARFVAPAAAVFAALSGPVLHAQDLAPRAYLITPVRSNAVTVSNVFNDGNIRFEGTVPITGATGRLNMPMLTLYRSLSLLGRSANVAATLPYGVGTFKGTIAEAEIEAYRSGLTRHQSIKVGYADGAYVRFGGDYRIASVAWQYGWVDKAK